MCNRRGGIVGNFLFLLLLAFVGWYVFTHHHWDKYLQGYGGRLENAVNKELTRLSVTDSDVLSQTRRIHSWKFLDWVETVRTIRSGDPHRMRDIYAALVDVSGHLGCSISRTQSAAGMRIEIKKALWVLQRITLVTSVSKPVIEPKPYPKSNARVAFVIDDVAYETGSMDRFASLGVPLTFAILPREKHSKELSQKALGLKFPVMLHLPMEPLDMVHNDPGPSGLYLKMSDHDLKAQFEKDVDSVPNIVGINNHMGSAFTESEPKMTLVMNWVKKRGVYFLDSHTSGHSVVCKVARRVGVPCLMNETFLDNKDDVKDIETQLDLVMKLALKEGQTIAIGHYRRKYLVEALANKIPEFRSRGIQIVTLPTFYNR